MTPSAAWGPWQLIPPTKRTLCAETWCTVAPQRPCSGLPTAPTYWSSVPSDRPPGMLLGHSAQDVAVRATRSPGRTVAAGRRQDLRLWAAGPDRREHRSAMAHRALR
jgi:hypothetical protein